VTVWTASSRQLTPLCSRGSRSVAWSRNNRMLLSISCRIMGNNRQGARKMDIAPRLALETYLIQLDTFYDRHTLRSYSRGYRIRDLARLLVLFISFTWRRLGRYITISHDLCHILANSKSPFHVSLYEVCRRWSALK
jgi:5-methylcytosine-specific restriction endonuclease McrA